MKVCTYTLSFPHPFQSWCLPSRRTISQLFLFTLVICSSASTTPIEVLEQCPIAVCTYSLAHLCKSQHGSNQDRGLSSGMKTIPVHVFHEDPAKFVYPKELQVLGDAMKSELRKTDMYKRQRHRHRHRQRQTERDRERRGGREK